MIGYLISRLDEFVPGQVEHSRPAVGGRSTNYSVDNFELMNLVVSLEHRFLGVQLKHNAPGQRRVSHASTSPKKNALTLRSTYRPQDRTLLPQTTILAVGTIE